MTFSDKPFCSFKALSSLHDSDVAFLREMSKVHNRPLTFMTDRFRGVCVEPKNRAKERCFPEQLHFSLTESHSLEVVASEGWLLSPDRAVEQEGIESGSCESGVRSGSP